MQQASEASPLASAASLPLRTAPVHTHCHPVLACQGLQGGCHCPRLLLQRHANCSSRKHCAERNMHVGQTSSRTS